MYTRSVKDFDRRKTQQKPSKVRFSPARTLLSGCDTARQSVPKPQPATAPGEAAKLVESDSEIRAYVVTDDIGGFEDVMKVSRMGLTSFRYARC